MIRSRFNPPALLALAATPAAWQVPEATDPATLHPEHASVYVESPAVVPLLRGYGSAPVVRMAMDPDVREAWARIASAMRLDLDAGLARVARALDVPIGGEAPAIRDALALLHGVDGVSFSLELREGSPGEFRALVARVRGASDELAALARRVRAVAADTGGGYPDALSEVASDPELADDPWGHPYEYASVDGGNSFALRCLGADGARGGDGAAADLEATPDGAGVGVAPSADAIARAELAERAGMLAIVDFSDAEHAAAFRSWLERALAPDRAATPETRATEGVRTFDGAWTLDLRGGLRIAIGFGAASFDELAQRASGQKPGFGGPAHRARIEQRCGEARGQCVARGALRATSWLDATAGAGGDDLLATIAGFLPRRWFADSVFRMQLDGERFITDAIAAGAADDAGWTSIVGDGPIEPAAASYVPDDAIGAALFTVDGNELYARVAASLGAAGDPEPLAELERQHGFRLREDVFGSLGRGCAIYLLPIQSALSLPGAAIVVELKDAQAFERGVTGVVKALGERADGPVQFKFKRYRDAPMWTLAADESAPSSPLLGMASPTLAIAKDRAIVAVSSLRAVKEVKRAMGEEGAPHAISGRVQDLPPDASLVGEVDWPALIDGAYGAARAGLTLAAAGVELPFDAGALAAALPEPRVFTRFFQPTVAWARVTDGATIVHVESSFGPETWLGLALLGGAIVDSIERGPPHELSAPGEPTPVAAGSGEAELDATRSAMRKLATPLAVYQIEFGRYPDGLKALVEPSERYPRGFLNGAELPLDGWGRPLAYRALDGGTSYQLWSLGADGVDGERSGDDVVAP